jgi:hypothetical protein
MVTCSFSGIEGYLSVGGFKIYCPPSASTTVKRVSELCRVAFTTVIDNLACTPGTATLRSTMSLANKAIWSIVYGISGGVGVPKNSLQHFGWKSPSPTMV